MNEFAHSPTERLFIGRNNRLISLRNRFTSLCAYQQTEEKNHLPSEGAGALAVWGYCKVKL